MDSLAGEIARIGGDDPLSHLDDPRWGLRRPEGDPAVAIRLLALDAILTNLLSRAPIESLPAVSETIRTRIISLKNETAGADK